MAFVGVRSEIVLPYPDVLLQLNTTMLNQTFVYVPCVSFSYPFCPRGKPEKDPTCGALGALAVAQDYRKNWASSSDPNIRARCEQAAASFSACSVCGENRCRSSHCRAVKNKANQPATANPPAMVAYQGASSSTATHVVSSQGATATQVVSSQGASSSTATHVVSSQGATATQVVSSQVVSTAVSFYPPVQDGAGAGHCPSSLANLLVDDDLPGDAGPPEARAEEQFVDRWPSHLANVFVELGGTDGGRVGLPEIDDTAVGVPEVDDTAVGQPAGAGVQFIESVSLPLANLWFDPWVDTVDVGETVGGTVGLPEVDDTAVGEPFGLPDMDAGTGAVAPEVQELIAAVFGPYASDVGETCSLPDVAGAPGPELQELIAAVDAHYVPDTSDTQSHASFHSGLEGLHGLLDEAGEDEGEGFQHSDSPAHDSAGDTGGATQDVKVADDSYCRGSTFQLPRWRRSVRGARPQPSQLSRPTFLSSSSSTA